MNNGHPMPMAAIRTRRATNVSLDAALLEEAKVLDINVSRAFEQGLAAQIAELRAERWLAENANALTSSNSYVEKGGLPLADYRRF
ncbi:type II toxin-antitoxin system CcdA family antitoxin [Croceibacterium ferulae]|uniref:type II toxin-antitoxin system CcdA family antitoxin n=1 Tax=Croceibacterium ferulae TaxID=1854641 RepID=UPI001F4D4863|nr:type II toxin-antitoxin system CcdA family antitoxin [Croceibacterium ferulae]